MREVIVTYRPDADTLSIGTLVNGICHFIFKGDGINISDGYHTVDELYAHRDALFIAFCKYQSWLIGAQIDGGIWKGHDVWRSKQHASSMPMYDGCFIMGIGKGKGEQVTYHLPLNQWDNTDFAETLETAPEFDGHTPNDVLARLKEV